MDIMFVVEIVKISFVVAVAVNFSLFTAIQAFKYFLGTHKWKE